MTTPYILYGRQGSGSFAVQVALEELRLPYERIWVGREATEVEKFRQVNPTGKVPALILPDGTSMFESSAMLIHLASIRSNNLLAPAAGSSSHAIFLQWMVFLSANVYESALRMFYPARYSSRGEEYAGAIAAQGAADYCGHLDFIGRRLGPYLMGADYSISDAYLYMLASWYEGDKSALLASMPALAAHTGLVGARAAVAAVDADHAQ
jgi:GST-like protein